MRKKALAPTLILILLVSGTAEMMFVNFAEANFKILPELPSPIYLRSDGSIEPPTAPIKLVGDTYVLQCNIADTIEVQRDNIVINGNGFILTKPAVNTDQLMTPIGWLPSIQLTERNNVTIRNAEFRSCFTGITAKNSTGIMITGNAFRSAEAHAVVFWDCYDSAIVENTMYGNDVAISLLETADYIVIENNTISGSIWHAVWGGISNSNIVGNDISDNGGIALYSIGSFNRIVGNNFENNDRGILGYQGNNIIHHNNFINSKEMQFHSNALNTFDDGEEGNYWSDYNGEDANDDGVGDTPYIIDTKRTQIIGNHSMIIGTDLQDTHPLMVPVNISTAKEFLLRGRFPSSGASPTSSRNASNDNIAPEVTVVSPGNRTYNERDIPLNFTISEACPQIRYCLDGQENMTISGNTTLMGLSEGVHNIKVYAIDYVGNNGASRAIHFETDEEELNLSVFPATLIIATSGVSLAFMSFGLVIFFMKRKREAEPS